MVCANCGSEASEGAVFCTSCGAPVGNAGATRRKTSDERKELLARQIANLIPRGLRVESQSDYQAVLVSGRRVNHVLHLILTLVTCLTWGIVWAALVIFGGEKREIAGVDEWGNVTVSRASGMSSKLIAGFAIVLGLIVLISIAVAAIGDTDNSDSGQSSGVSSVPTRTLEPLIEVNAERVLNDYRTNETAANVNWKGKRLLVTLQVIDEIEDGGKVIKRVGFGLNHIQMDFTDINDVIHLTPGDSITANCKLDGFQLDTWLEFSDCKSE